MWTYNVFSIVVVILTTQLLSIECQCPLSSERKKSLLYEKLCYEPIGMPSTRFTIETFDTKAPSDGWFVFYGSDIFRNKFTSLLKEETLISNESYEDICFSIEKADSYIGNTAIGAFDGFGQKRAAIWNCTASVDFSGLFRCHIRNALSKYHQNLNFYFTDTEIENVQVTVVCFSNGDVGWHTLSIRNTFSQEDFSAVKNQVRNLGFPTTNMANMFNSNCNTYYTKNINITD